MNNFPQRRLEKIAPGAPITAAWLNRIVDVVNTLENSKIPHIRKDEIIKASWLNRIAESVERRTRKNRTIGGMDKAYFYRAGKPCNVAPRVFRKIRAGDAILAKWLNALVDTLNEIVGIKTYSQYFYYPVKDSHDVETTHPWKVTPYYDAETKAWRLRINAAHRLYLTNSANGTIQGGLQGFGSATMPNEAFFVSVGAPQIKTPMGSVVEYPFDAPTNPVSNFVPWLYHDAAVRVSVTAGTPDDDGEYFVVATGMPIRNDDGEIVGAEINQIMMSDSSIGFSCGGGVHD